MGEMTGKHRKIKAVIADLERANSVIVGRIDRYLDRITRLERQTGRVDQLVADHVHLRKIVDDAINLGVESRKGLDFRLTQLASRVIALEGRLDPVERRIGDWEVTIQQTLVPNSGRHALRLNDLEELLLPMDSGAKLGYEFAKMLRSDIDQVNDRLTLHIGHRGTFAHGTVPEPDYADDAAAEDWKREQAGQ